jgi:hypothetical protein
MNKKLSNDFPPGFENDEKNVSIDFDGVIHNNDKGWYDGTCYGEPIEGSIEAIKFLAKDFNIIVFTAKAKPNRPLVNKQTGKQLVEDWLKKYDLFEYIYEVTSEKPRAKIYIDDKGYKFINWNKTINDLEVLE